MDKSGQIYTDGLWLVKPGNETAFIAAWRTFAEWTMKNQLGAVEGRLLQDLDHPQRFISFGHWKDIQTIQAWRELPEFRTFLKQSKGIM